MNLKVSGVYCIHNTWTDKFYIGSSANVEARIKRHIRMLKNGAHHSPKLQASWALHGEDCFEAGILISCERKDLLQREQEMIVSFDAVDNGYNISKSSSSPMAGRKQTDETRAKMRESHAERKPISEETREKHRQAAIKREAAKKAAGFVVSEETRQKLSASGKGRIVSEETKAKLSEKNKGQKLTEEQAKKHSEAHKGFVLPEDRRKKLSDGAKRYWKEYREAKNAEPA